MSSSSPTPKNALPGKPPSGRTIALWVAIIGGFALVLSTALPPIVSSLVQVATPTIVSLSPTPDNCTWQIGTISSQKIIANTGEQILLNIQAVSTTGGALLYSWRASVGTVYPTGATADSAATYITPARPTTDTIFVDISLPNTNCPQQTKSITVSVIQPQIPTLLPSSSTTTAGISVLSGTSPDQIAPPPIPDEIAEAEVLLVQARQWTSAYSETFTFGTPLWVPNPDQIVQSTIAISNNQLAFDVNALVGSVVVDWPNVPSPMVTDFYAAVDLRRIEGATDTGAGLSFREDAALRLYGFRINDRGEVFISIFAPTGNKRLKTFQSGAILPLSQYTNRLEVIGQGSQFFFFVNGSYIGSLIDTQIAIGTVDVLVFIPRQERAVYSFDNLEVRTP